MPVIIHFPILRCKQVNHDESFIFCDHVLDPNFFLGAPEDGHILYAIVLDMTISMLWKNARINGLEWEVLDGAQLGYSHYR